MNKEEVEEMMSVLNNECFLCLEELYAEFVKRKESAGFTDDDVLTCVTWVYYDLKEKGVKSWYHKDKQRPAPNALYICEMINMVLFSKTCPMSGGAV